MKYKIKIDLFVRSSPSINAKTIGTLKAGKVVNVSGIKSVTEVQKTIKSKVTVPWGKISFDGKTGYISTKAKYVSKVKTDYGKLVGAQLLLAAEKAVKNKAKHVSGAYQFKGSKVNCAVFTAYCYYKAGLLPKGTIPSHTGSGLSHKDAFKHCSIHKVNCLYKNLPAKYKKVGTLCVQESNQFIIGSDGLYTTHSTGKTYTSLSMIRHKSSGDYEHSHKINLVVVPNVE